MSFIEVDKLIKKIFVITKKIVFSAFLIYGFNLVASPLNLIIPINFITVGLITVLGLPALLSLIAIFLIIF
ncbi:MAG: hypothetical protein E7169_03515 [Firmicutes bacterium]|nr:hypothetical protein [Bacillota bacterium]